MRKKEIKLEGLDSDFIKHDREFLQAKTQLTAADSSALAMWQTRKGEKKSKSSPETIQVSYKIDFHNHKWL